MYKVIFADDEPIALMGLNMLTDWEKVGFEICGSCSNGEEALTAVQNSRPDLIITDIRMPVLDGLELIRRTKQVLGPDYDPIFVIMSGYGDFEYARSALRCGVKHYLLKPVLDTDWAPIMAEIQEELEAKRVTRAHTIWSQSRLLESILARLLRGDMAELDLETAELFEQLDHESSGWRYIHIEGESGEAAEVVNRSKPPYPKAFQLNWTQGQIGLVVDNSLDIVGLADSIFHELMTRGAKPSVTVGPPVGAIHKLPVSYLGAMEASVQYFYQSEQGPVFYGMDTPTKLSYDMKVLSIVEMLLDSAEKLKEEETSSLINSLFRLFQEERTSPKVIQTLSIYVVLKTFEGLRELGAASELPANFRDFLHTVPNSITELEQSLRAYLDDYMNRLRNHKESVCSHPLHAVKRYIRDNYRSSLTIKEIGARFYMNPVYLGNAFSNKYGVSIIECIHDHRIQEAKRLLRETNHTVCSIAEEVGYAQYNHFLSEFCKRVSEKPNVYRKKNSTQ